MSHCSVWPEVRYCVAKRQPDGTYLCRCGQRGDADLHPIGGS